MTERIEIEGIDFEYEPERLKGWRAFQLLKQSREAKDDYERVENVLAIACYIVNMGIEEFVDKCGGEDTNIEVIVRIASELIAGAYPKN